MANQKVIDRATDDMVEALEKEKNIAIFVSIANRTPGGAATMRFVQKGYTDEVLTSAVIGLIDLAGKIGLSEKELFQFIKDGYKLKDKDDDETDDCEEMKEVKAVLRDFGKKLIDLAKDK